MRKVITGAAASLLAANSAIAFPFYGFQNASVDDLGALGGNSYNSVAYGINDLGDLVGWSSHTDGKNHAFVYLAQYGQMFSIHDSTVPFSSATAFAINNNRVAVGEYSIPNTFQKQSFYYYPGIWLWPSPPNATPQFTWDATAYSINASDRIAGWAGRHPMPGDPPLPNTAGACHDQLPVVWSNAGVNPAQLFCIADPDGDKVADGGLGVRANDINDSGNVVGIDAVTSTYGMFFYKNSNQTRYSVPAPANLPVTSPNGNPLFGHANGLNNSDRVVGAFQYFPPGGAAAKLRAFYWNGVSAQSTDLGFLDNGTNSVARKVNNSNFVVGYSERNYNGSQRKAAFIWHSNFGMKQLPALAFTGTYDGTTLITAPRDCEAHAVSELQNGVVQVAGYCYLSGSTRHAVRWDVNISVANISL
jgi:probable HAF family extracellular repeat protein